MGGNNAKAPENLPCFPGNQAQLVSRSLQITTYRLAILSLTKLDLL